MANENVYGGYDGTVRRETAAVASADELRRSVEELGDKLRQLREQEPYAPSSGWLEEAERRNESLMTSLEDYRQVRAEEDYKRELAERRANESAWERTKRNVQANHESLHEYMKTAAQNVAGGFRKSWDGVTHAFHRSFGRDQRRQDQGRQPGPRVTWDQEAALEEERRRASRDWKTGSGY